MRHATALLLVVMAACNGGGGNSIRETPKPSLNGPPEVALEPNKRIGDVPFGTLGAELTVTLDINAPEGLDEDASSVTFTGVPLQPAGDGVWSRTLDGEEGEGIKVLDIVLVDDLGQQTRISEADDGGTLAEVGFDFRPPTADCTLSPAEPANATQEVTLALTASEDLAEAPALVFTPDTVDPGTPQQAGRTYTWTLGFPAGADIDYTFVATAEDAAGNPQEGDSLCDPASRQGVRLGQAPEVIDDDVVIAATPAELVEGIPWVRAGADVSVTLPTSEPISVDDSTVTLSGLVLAHRQGQTWGVTLTGDEGDGPKSLDARLFDEAGNTVREQRADVLRFDFTPPTATCVLTPNPANATDTMVLEVRASEPLQAAPLPTADDPRVQLGPADVDGVFYRYTVSLTEPGDVPFSLEVPALDRAGNAPTGGSLCAAASRQGSLLTIGPAIDGDVTVGATPSVDVDGTPWVRDGAEVFAVIPTTEPVDPSRSTVTLSGTPMVWDPGDGRWELTVETAQGDGPKDLQVHLEDEAGNPLDTRVNGAVRFDFTPPAADCILAPVQANAADSTITLSVFPSETLSDDGPQVVADQPGFTIDPAVRTGLGWEIDLTPPADTNVPTYTLTVQATDQVGNAQTGDSLCEPDTRTGSYAGVLPAPDGTPTLFVSPSVDDNGTPRARAGALVVLNLPTVDPIDPQRSFVSLSGQVLSSTDGVTWTGNVTAALGDGPKTLFATLVDAAGNVRDASFPDVGYIADFTPPAVATAVLSRDPFRSQAIGDDTLYVTVRDPLAGDITVNARVFPTEALGTAPVLSVSPAPGLAFGPPEDLGGSHRWTLPAVPAGQDGVYTLSVVLRDRVGNLSDPIPLDTTITVDTVGPVPPDVATAGRTFHLRAPWGQGADSPTSTSAVVGEPGAAMPGTTVYITTNNGGPLANTTAEEDGSFAAFPGGDESELWAAQTDEAGNLSVLVRVRDVRWLARIERKVPGSSVANPHTLTTTPRFDATVFGDPELVEEIGDGNFGLSIGASWQRLGFGGPDTPPQRNAAEAVYDPARGRVLVFGGAGPGDVQLGDLWSWDGNTWTEVRTTVSPPPRSQFAMGHDVTRGVTVLHGGLQTGATGDTWEFDGTIWTPFPDAGGPTQFAHEMVFDRSRDVMVMMTGFFDDGSVAVWEYDTADHRWQLVQPEGPRPEGVYDAQVAYDGIQGRVMLFGGRRRGDGQATQEQWAWDGERWTEITSGVLPPPRWGGAMFSLGTQNVVLVGGEDSNGYTDDVWAWDGQGWFEVSETPGPSIRSAIALDENRGQVLLLPGEPGQAAGESQRVWAWDLAGEWRALDLQTTPSPRREAAMAFDPVRSESVLFGGFLGSPFRTAETWVLDERGWRLADDGSGPGPTPRFKHNLVYDGDNDRILMFGGDAGPGAFADDLWQWDGTQWTEVATNAGPTGRLQFDWAWDQDRGVIVLFGGKAFDGVNPEFWTDDTWELDGNTWTRLTPPASPSGREMHSMAWDDDRGVIVLYGGQNGAGRNAETWEWDGTTWTPRFVNPAPSWRDRADMVYDPERTQVLLFGGDAPGGVTDTTLLFDGATWQELGAGTRPPARNLHAMAYDDFQGHTVLFGGFNGGLLSDTWVLSSATQDRPGSRFTAQFAAAAAEAQDVQSISVLWRAGGSGWTESGTPRDGAQLLVWERGRWNVVAAHSASAPQPLCWQVRADASVPALPGCQTAVDADRLQRLLRFGATEDLHVAVRTTGQAQDREATLTSEDVTVQVNYRLPPFSSNCGEADADADGRCDDDPGETCFGDDATGDSDGDGTCDDRDVCQGADATGDFDEDGVCDDLDLCWGPDSAGDANGDGVCDDATVIASWDFEGCPSGWTGTGAWACGTPSVEPPPFEGDDVFGTNLTGSPSPNAAWSFADQTAVSPEITLLPGDNVLSMNVWFDLGVGDGALVAYQPQGDPQAYVWAGSLPYTTNIQGLDAWSGDASDAGWRQVSFPFPAVLTQPQTLRIAIFVATDDNDDSLGLYIDDLVVANRPAD